MNKDKDLEAAIDRISATPDDGIEAQVDREIIRFWNDKVGNAVGETRAKYQVARKKIVKNVINKE